MPADVRIPMTASRVPVLPRYMEFDPEQHMPPAYSTSPRHRSRRLASYGAKATFPAPGTLTL